MENYTFIYNFIMFMSVMFYSSQQFRKIQCLKSFTKKSFTFAYSMMVIFLLYFVSNSTVTIQRQGQFVKISDKTI